MTLIMSLFMFLGCPLPPSENGATNSNNAVQNSGNAPKMNGKPSGAPSNLNAGNAGATPGATQGNAGSGSKMGNSGPKDGGQNSGGPGGILMDMEQMKEQKNQEQIKSLEHVTISGRIEGSCDGLLRLDVIDTEDLGGPKDGGEMKGPITSLVMEQAGNFSIVIPKGMSVNLSALCDTDRNQKITADVDKLSLGARLGVVDDDVADVSLTLEEIKPPSGDLPPEKPKED